MTAEPSARRHPVRLGLVGIGHWGRRLAPHLELQSDLVAVCSTGGRDGREWIARHLPGVAHVTRVEELLASPIDAVVIASPRTTHEDIVEAAISSGKHVLVEKPLAARAAQADELHRLAQERGLVLAVDYTHLYDTAFEALSRSIDDVNQLELDWRKPGSVTVDDVLYEFFPHVLSMAVSVDPLVQVRHARVVATPNETSIEARLVGPQVTLDATVSVGGDERVKRLVARGPNGDRELIWTDRQLEERRGSTVVAIHRADEEPLARVVASFLEAVSAKEDRPDHDRAWPSRAVLAKTPALLDQLIALVRPGADPG